ncbi:RHS repeat-associated core domain-containing protein [Xanthomonas sp. 1678]|uniref:RHS repeat-associated core domain-containing protein n=1 Tax=Xanthomonas sp. 1678 TaxID=3158788 RepID=UPI00285CB4FC|nr:RHS repeat-associated protein [Xanthomonas translucens]
MEFLVDFVFSARKRRLSFLVKALIGLLVMFLVAAPISVLAAPDNPCGSRSANCTKAQALADAQSALEFYQNPNNYPPSIGAYLVDVPAVPGDEYGNYCVRWTNPSGCYWVAFYRQRVFPPMPENPCSAYPYRKNCTQGMALAIANAALDYYQQRQPAQGPYIAEYEKGADYGSYCVRWTNPSGCYFLVYYYFPMIEYEVGKNQGPPSCHTPEASCGNPINVATGNKYQVEQDWGGGGGVPEFSRYYNSGVNTSALSEFGGHWTHTYSRRIELIQADGIYSVKVYRPAGGFERFNSSGAGWSAGVGVTATLESVQDSSGADAGWIYTSLSNRDVERYDQLGRLREITKITGENFKLEYLSNSEAEGVRSRQLVRVIMPTGRFLSFGYDTSNKLVSVEDSSGGLVSYSYTGYGLLSSASRAGGTRGYVYGESQYTAGGGFPWALTGIIDEAGQRFATYSYDQNAKAISTVHAGDVEKFQVAYASQTSLEVTLPSGLIERKAITLVNGVEKVAAVNRYCNGCPSQDRNFSYDANGFIDRVMDENGVVDDYDYDDRGGLIFIREGIAADGVARRTVSYSRDSESGLPLVEEIGSDSGALKRTSWTYNERSQIMGKEFSDPITGVARAMVMSYCEQVDINAGRCPLLGLVTSIDGARSDVADLVSFTYYQSDEATCATTPTACPHRKGDLWKVTSALGQVTEYLAYDGAGRVLSAKDANGLITDYTYHPRGWLTASKVRGADDTSESDDRITLIDYWPTGLVKQVTQPDGAFTTFTYDTAHRLTDIADNAGNTLHYTLDNAGNRVKEDTKDAAGTLKRTLSRVYNQLGQLATQATASGDPTDFGYDANGNTKTVTDALGHVTQNDYDPLNRLARTLQDVGGIAAETKFGYDALDNLTKVTDPKGLDTTYAYNGLGDLTKFTSPDTGVTTYTYDSAGNRATQIDARNIKTTYSYDALNRLTKVAYPTSGLNVTYSYDISQTVCASGETYATGRLARMQDASGTTDYCYDRFGDLVRKVQTTNGKVFVLRYAYTKAGQLSRLTYPDGAAVDYVRNAQGQTTEVGVTPAGGTRHVLLGNATYSPFGPLASWSYGNGRPMQRVLDQDYRPLAVSDTRSDGLSSGFAFDPAGNLSALTAAGNTAPVVSLDYDALGRLTAFKDGPTGAVIDGYSYDATGNRLSAKVNTTTQSYTYPTTSHRLSAVAGTARTYDAIGNTLSIGGTAQEFAYDATGRMSQAKRAGAVVMKYGYNGRGEQVRRVSKTNTYTLYDESGHWLGDYDINGAPLQQAIWLDDLPVGVLAKNSLRYVQSDHLGTPRAVIDPVRDVAIWKWDLKGEAFGNTPPNQDPDGDGTTFVFDMRFPGQRYDSATGFNQNYFRDYEPGTGRYGQSDPIGLNGGYSTYAYVGGSSMGRIDPLGLRSPNEQEAAFISSLFGDCFDFASIDISGTSRERASSLSGGSVSIPASLFNGGDVNKGLDLYSVNARSTLAHEVFHVWQRRQGARVTSSLVVPQIANYFGFGDPYVYGASTSAGGAALYFNDLFNRGRYEGQAQMWEDSYLRADQGGLASEIHEALKAVVAAKSSCGCK